MGLWFLIRDAVISWINHNAQRLGAALAYYGIFSIAPLLIIATALAGFFFGPEAVEGRLKTEIKNYIGPEGAGAIEDMVANANQSRQGIVAGTVSIGILVFGALGLFAELQSTLNTVWGVQVKARRGILGFLRDRLFSFLMMVGTLLVLFASLILGVIQSALEKLSGVSSPLISHSGHMIASITVATLLFGILFRLVPDARITWREVWLGALVTALLFTLGNWLIGIYLGRASVVSAYGAAGSLAALLIWLYYSALVFVFGAELTKAYADRYGAGTIPSARAEYVRGGSGIHHAPGS